MTEFSVQHSAFIVDCHCLMTCDGTLKIIDFGLVKADELEEGPTGQPVPTPVGQIAP